jgi:hypothetical protein
MNWPPVSILIVTYDRPREIRMTIDALKENIDYPGKVLWHLADDSTPDASYLYDLQHKDYKDLHFTATVTEREGWGANVNKAMLDCWQRSPYIFLCEDDYVSQRTVNLRAGIAVMQTLFTVGLIRYDGVQAHALDFQMREIETEAGRFDCLTITKTSPFLNIYSNRPHLKHRRFHDHYGVYPAGLKLGMTETSFAHTVRNKYQHGPKVAVLRDGIELAFSHIGHSRQRSSLDVGSKG